MSIIDFKEIPQAHGNGESGLTDTFELFAEQFFHNLGFKIIKSPSRGADNGKDLIIEETIKGVLDESESKILWMVSCKHKAHSGNSVKPDDETNLIEKITSHNCQGFIGFYSTIPSTGLDTIISGLSNRGIKTKVLNAQKIEESLLKDKTGIKLIERFFPISFGKWSSENPTKAKIFKDGEFQLKCMVCDEDLVIENKVQGNFYYLKRSTDLNTIVGFKWSCFGECDRRLTNKIHANGLIEFMDHAESKATAGTFILFVLDTIRDMQNESSKLTNEAFLELRYFLCAIYPYIARNMTSREMEVLDMELMMRQVG